MSARPTRRALFVDDRHGALRVTWHEAKERVVFSLWRSDVCVGTCQMTLEDTDRLLRFLRSHMGPHEAHDV
ncbi:MAG: hypothetical protein ACRDZO_20960 [Egibacteraceae bacterium]